MEQPMNQETASRYPNVVVEENRVSVAMPFAWLGGIVATGIYLVILYAMVDDGFPFRQISLGYLIAFLVFTAAWLWYMAGRRVVTVFDAHNRRAHRRNLLYAMPSVDFADIAEITAVHTGNTVFYKIALKTNKLGKGLRISASYQSTDLEHLHLAQKALPAINAMLAAGNDSRAVSVNQAKLAENPACYIKTGSQYVQRRWFWTIVVIVVGAIMVISGVQRGDWVKGLIGIAAFLYTLLIINSVVIDASEKTISFGRAFGKWKKTYSLDRFVGIGVTRSHTNGFYTGTSADIEFTDPSATVRLAHSYFTGRLSTFVDETNAIINAALGGGKSDKTDEE